MKLWSLAMVAGIGLGLSTQPFSCFPRMRDTPSIKPFERQMPEMPERTEAFGAPTRPATRAEAASLPNPVPSTSRSRELGRIYYGYYCQMCHAADGRGDGTVGRSYVPPPADLTGPRVQAMPEGELAFAMAAGEGHEPVLGPAVPWERRWYIVRHLRSIAGPSPTSVPAK
ncbi:MAG: cytochrome C [Armatimonadota bacterium]